MHRVTSTRIGWALLVLMALAAPLREAQASQTLVVLAQDSAQSADERSVAEHITIKMAHNQPTTLNTKSIFNI